MKMNNKALAGILLAGAAMLTPSMASAQVAGIAYADKIDAIMGVKAFQDAYKTLIQQSVPKRQRIEQLSNEIATISTPMDTNKDGRLTEADSAWSAALTQREAAQKASDKNSDGVLTGTEITEYRAKNLPAEQIIARQTEIQKINDEMQIDRLYVIDIINKQYNTTLKSIVTTKKINAVFRPEAFEYAPEGMSITGQLVAGINAAVPAVPMPMPKNYQFLQESVALQSEIDQIIAQQLTAAARAQQQQQQQQGAAPAQGQPTAPAQPAPKPPAGEQPESR